MSKEHGEDVVGINLKPDTFNTSLQIVSASTSVVLVRWIKLECVDNGCRLVTIGVIVDRTSKISFD